jgi:hypothetical protein
MAAWSCATWDPSPRLRGIRIHIVNDHLPLDGALKILAFTALAVVSAKDACLEALAVFLETSRFFAKASLKIK